MAARSSIRTQPLLGRWIVGTVLGLALGTLLAIILSSLVVNLFYPKETNLIVGLCVGGTIGLFQILAVRRWVSLDWGWIWGAMLMFGPPFIAAVIFEELAIDTDVFPGRLWFGIVTALGWLAGASVQARTLRCHTPRAWWWIGATAVSLSLAFAASTLVGEIGAALVLAVVSGALLLLLLQPGGINTAPA